MSCGCNKTSGCKSSACESKDCKYTGQLIFDGLDFICQTESEVEGEDPVIHFQVNNGESFNNVLSQIFTLLCQEVKEVSSTNSGDGTVFHGTNALGSFATGGTGLGAIMPDSTYVVPVGGAGEYEVEYSVEAQFVTQGDATFNIAKDGVSIGSEYECVLALIDSGPTNVRYRSEVRGRFTANDGEQIDVWGLTTGNSQLFKSICTIKKIS